MDEENVLDPLGMSNSRFTTAPEKFYKERDLTWGHQGRKVVRNRYPEYAAAGLYSNCIDLSNVIIMLNNQGLINGEQF